MSRVRSFVNEKDLVTGSTGASQHTNAGKAKEIITTFIMSDGIHRVCESCLDSRGGRPKLKRV